MPPCTERWVEGIARKVPPPKRGADLLLIGSASKRFWVHVCHLDCFECLNCLSAQFTGESWARRLWSDLAALVLESSCYLYSGYVLRSELEFGDKCHGAFGCMPVETCQCSRACQKEPYGLKYRGTIQSRPKVLSGCESEVVVG